VDQDEGHRRSGLSAKPTHDRVDSLPVIPFVTQLQRAGVLHLALDARPIRSDCLTGAFVDRLTHGVDIMALVGDGSLLGLSRTERLKFQTDHSSQDWPCAHTRHGTRQLRSGSFGGPPLRHARKKPRAVDTGRKSSGNVRHRDRVVAMWSLTSRLAFDDGAPGLPTWRRMRSVRASGSPFSLQSHRSASR